MTWCSCHGRAICQWEILKPFAKPTGLAVASLMVAGWLNFALAQDKGKKPHYPKPPAAENVPLVPEAWKAAPRKPTTPAEIDHLLAQAQKTDKLSPAPLITDEEFIRRASLDLTGKLPSPAQIEEFVKS